MEIRANSNISEFDIDMGVLAQSLGLIYSQYDKIFYLKNWLGKSERYCAQIVSIRNEETKETSMYQLKTYGMASTCAKIAKYIESKYLPVTMIIESDNTTKVYSHYLRW